MNIAVNTRFLLPGRLEGLGWYTYEVMHRMVQQHPEHQFIFLFDRPFDERFVFADNVVPKVVFPPARHPALWYLWFEWALPRILRQVKADVFLSPDSYCSLRTTTPTLMVTHDIAHVHYPEQIPSLVRRYYDYFVPKYLNSAHKVVTISNFCKTDIIEYYNIPSEKITVAHNGSREGFFPLSGNEQQAVRDQFADGKPYFFYVGALHPRKNLVRLIQAFDQFKQQTAAPVQLLIGGRMAWQTGEIAAAKAAAQHEQDIQFLGYLDDQDLKKLLAASLALTYVSLFEGFGLPILEAMYSETAVICSNVSSMPEVAGEAALKVDPTSTDEIAAAMQYIWRKPEERQALIEKGKLQREKFNWDETARILYQELN
ncbi:MAG: glycosyltransferase family 4 protein, partial [Saprospiraceae bacterium]|nr:glycosyltransferase family 4 protein [Saprospiraceae bacterium]